MPAQTYFKTAAAEIRKAVQEKRHDVDQLKKQLAEREQMARQYIDQLRKDKNQKEWMVSSGNIDNNRRMDLEREAQQDLAQVTNTEQSLNAEKDNLNKSVANLEQEIRDLDQLASSLEARQ